MIALLLALALGPLAQSGGAASAFESFVFTLPAGWTRTEQNQDLFLKPGDLDSGQSFVVALAHEHDMPAGTLDQALEQAWLEFAGAGSTVTDRSSATQITTAAGATGLWSSGILEARGARVFITVAVFKPDDHFRVIASLANSDAANQKYRGAFADLLKSVEFRKDLPPAPDAASGATSSMSSNYELLLTLASGLNVSPSGGSDYGAGTYVYCVFTDGTWLATAPNRGLTNYDLGAEQRSHASDFGKWQRDNKGVLTLRTPYRVETLFPQPDSSYVRKDKEAREGTYFRIPTSTGLRFAGRYIKEGQSDGPFTASITFRADGTFEDHGVVHMILPDEIGVRYRDISEVLGPGSGVYEIANNTLTLAYADGRRKPMLFMLTPELAKKMDPDAIYLGKIWFARR